MPLQLVADQAWPVRAHRRQNERFGFLVAYALVALAGLWVGLLMGWAVWG